MPPFEEDDPLSFLPPFEERARPLEPLLLPEDDPLQATSLTWYSYSRSHPHSMGFDGSAEPEPEPPLEDEPPLDEPEPLLEDEPDDVLPYSTQTSTHTSSRLPLFLPLLEPE